LISSVCLEDVRPDAGPIFCYPGSHTIPPYQSSTNGANAEMEMSACRAYLANEIAARGLAKTALVGLAGDVFLWHSQLLHGGLPVRNASLTRKSLLTRYARKQDVHK
jgi:ectoine hydroxylase-related dioxygenase (phytanoyl-CoA dioxygenase family)